METKDVIIKGLKKEIKNLYFRREEINRIVKILEDKFWIPTGESMDYIEERQDLADANELRLFAFAYAIDEVIKSNLVDKYFTDIEAKVLTEEKEEQLEMKFPIRIDCFQVTPQQWIGASNVGFLMQLRNAQLISYNANTQRAMKRIVHGGADYYRININKKSVKEICEAFEQGAFIPNTITLNIPDTETDFYYDAKAKQLVIKSIDHFDMTDGYHRYIAMSTLYNKGEFDYPIELRIQNFPEFKARRFIYQEDQKTQMSKPDSDAMNTLDPCNQVVDRINEDPSSIMSGMISRIGGKVNFSDMASVIRYFFYGKEASQSIAAQKLFVVNTSRDLIERLNGIFMATPTLIEQKKISFKELMIIFRCISLYGDQNECNWHVCNVLKNQDKIEDKGFEHRKPRKGLVTRIDDVL